MAGRRPTEDELDAWVEVARVEARRSRVALQEADAAEFAQRSIRSSAKRSAPKRSGSAVDAGAAPMKAAAAAAAAAAPRSKRRKTGSLRARSLSAFSTDVVAATRKALLPFYGRSCAIETKESFKAVCRYLSKKILAKEMAKEDEIGDTARFTDATRRRIAKYISEERVAAALAAM